MPSFKQRSCQKELLDSDDLPFKDIEKNMQELNIINHRLGGHRITLQGLEKVLKKHTSTDLPVYVVEIGCGGGDNLRVIKKWAENKNFSLELTGIDINPQCIAFAKQQEANNKIVFVHSDYRDVRFEKKPDIIFSSLFCHHFTDEEITSMLGWMIKNSNTGFFINDLHRHPLAYYSIRLLTGLFSRSYLVKNDAPVSVLRAFRKKDWTKIFQRAGIHHYHCSWQWAFRWLVTYCKYE